MSALPRAQDLLAETDWLFESSTPEVGYAADAACHLVFDAAMEDEDPGVEDADLPSDEWTSEYWSALAVAGDEPAENAPARRREFWTWWLDEAVPAAADAGLRPE